MTILLFPYLTPFFTLSNIKSVRLGLGTLGILGDFLKLRLEVDLEVGEFLWRVQCPRARRVSPRTGAPVGVCCRSWWAFMAGLPPNEWLLRTGVDLLLYVASSNWTWLSNWNGSFLVTGTVMEKKTYSSGDLVTLHWARGVSSTASIHANIIQWNVARSLKILWCQTGTCKMLIIIMDFPYRILFPILTFSLNLLYIYQ